MGDVFFDEVFCFGEGLVVEFWGSDVFEIVDKVGLKEVDELLEVVFFLSYG